MALPGPVTDIAAAVFFCANSHFYSVLRYYTLSAAVSDLARGLGVGACNASGRDAFRPITGVNFKTELEWVQRRKKKMTKTHKAVLSTLAVLCLLFMGSGVAQAQLCVAQAQKVGVVRAEGITEVVADIELRCGQPTEDTFGFNQIPARIDIAVELNARITNGISDTRFVEVLATGDLHYKSREIDLRAFQLTDATGAVSSTPIPDSVFNGVDATGSAMVDGGKLSEDSTTIVWKNVATGQPDPTLEAFEVPTDGHLNLNGSEAGFSLVIEGLRVNASSVGDGGDITAVVMVKGSAVGNPLKVADVSTGLAIKATAAEGLQCTNSDSTDVAMITIQEGYAAGIMTGVQGVTAVTADAGADPPIEEVMGVTAVTGDTVLVTFTGIPEGVSVMVPDEVGLAPNAPGTAANETLESFRLALVSSGRDTGIDGKVVDGVATVMLSAAGNGSVVYRIFDASERRC